MFGAPGEWTLVRCSNRACRLIWLNPMPLLNDIGLAYRDYGTHSSALSKTGAARSHRAETALKNIAKWVFRYDSDEIERQHAEMQLGSYPPGRLLEIGSGSGEMLGRMRDRGWDVVGIDTDPVAIERSRKIGIPSLAGLVEDMDLDHTTFDAVTMLHSFEHIHNPRAVLSTCVNLLKPGGTLVVVTPNGDSVGRQLFGWAWWALDPPRHLYIYNPRSLRVLIEASSLEVLSCRTSVRDAAQIFTASKAIRAGGRYVPGSRRAQPIGSRIYAILLHTLLKLRPSRGEELIVMAVKR